MSTGSFIIDMAIWACVVLPMTWFMNRRLDNWKGPAVDRPDLPYFILWITITVPSFLWIFGSMFFRELNRIF